MSAALETCARLAEIARRLADASAIDPVCVALEQGRFTRASTIVARAEIAEGNGTVEALLRELQIVWKSASDDLSASSLIWVLGTTAITTRVFRNTAPIAQGVWTGPTVEGSYLRATKEVVREILRAATRQVLVVGYWISARDNGDGIVEEVIGALAEAVRKGVTVRVVIDERIRANGQDNRQIFLSAWPHGTALPHLLTWRLPPLDSHLKLHAKVIVADMDDALVTSANLTLYALERNMEMGVRVSGKPASDIFHHFRLLENAGVLKAF
jgi:cardiolipin synthase